MVTLQDVLDALDLMNIEPDEVPISRATRNYLIEKAEEVLNAENDEKEEE
ncbi:hypothetical protein ACFLTO_05195 [Chloroflexota bacterium]